MTLVFLSTFCGISVVLPVLTGFWPSENPASVVAGSVAGPECQKRRASGWRGVVKISEDRSRKSCASWIPQMEFCVQSVFPYCFLRFNLIIFPYCSILVGGLKTFFIFAYIGDNNPNWLSYFSEGLVETTNQILFHQKMVTICTHNLRYGLWDISWDMNGTWLWERRLAVAKVSFDVPSQRQWYCGICKAFLIWLWIYHFWDIRWDVYIYINILMINSGYCFDVS